MENKSAVQFSSEETSDEPAEGPPKKRSCSEILKNIFQNITIEPVLFLFLTGIAIHAITSENLLIEKVCLTINEFPKEVCAHIQEKKYKDRIDAVQKKVSYWKIIISLSTVIFSIFYSIVVGSWSDRHGRKTFIVLPICGLTIGTFIYMIQAHYLYSPVWLFVIQGIVPSLFGGYGLFVCALAYIADISTPENRTIRFAILEACAMIGFPTGVFIGGAIFKSYGYIAVFATSAVIEVIAVLYAIFRLEESKKDLVSWTVQQRVRDLFRFNNIIDSFKAFTSSRDRRARLTLILLLGSALITHLSEDGIMKIKYLFIQKIFNWGVSEYSNYTSITMLAGIFVTGLLVALLVYKLKLNDGIIGAIGAIAAIVGFSLIANAKYTWMLYAATIIGIQQAVISITSRSIITKIISKEDIGKVLSFLTCCEQASPLIADSVYPAVYASTVDIYPGLLFMVTAFLYLYPLALFLWLTIDVRNKDGEKTPLVINNDEETA